MHGTIVSRFTITFVFYTVIIIIICSVLKVLNYLFNMIIDYLKNIFRN